MNPIALISTDFDGTCVCSTQDPPFATALGQIIRTLQKQGVYWVINTGRTLDQVIEGMDAYCGDLEPDFLITAEREIHRRNGEGEWEDYGDWNQRCNESYQALHAGLGEFFPHVKAYFQRDTTAGDVIEWDGRVEGVVSRDDGAMLDFIAFLESVRSRWPLLGWERNSVYLRFSHREYHKGSALMGLAKMLGVPAESVFAAGDDYNDLSMLTGVAARFVACPSNAVDAVKEAVTKAGGFIARGHAGSGIAEALEHFSGVSLKRA